MRISKIIDMAFGLFGLVGVGIILFYGHKLKTQIDEIRPEMDAVMGWTNTSTARWEALDQFNKGKITVPKVVGEEIPAIDVKHPKPILIVAPLSSPSPSATATLEPPATATPRPVRKVMRHR